MSELKKRFWVFIITQYYPSGGFNDIVLSTDSFNAAKKCYNSNIASDITTKILFDSECREIVCEDHTPRSRCKITEDEYYKKIDLKKEYECNEYDTLD